MGKNQSQALAAGEAPRTATHRRMKILAWMQEEGSARVRDLSAAFGVSDVTIRQDLERLELEGFVVREHGGAYLQTLQQQVRALALQHQVHMEQKKRIGRAAAGLVVDGETIILDSGSTTTEVADNRADCTCTVEDSSKSNEKPLRVERSFWSSNLPSVD